MTARIVYALLLSGGITLAATSAYVVVAVGVSGGWAGLAVLGALFAAIGGIGLAGLSDDDQPRDLFAPDLHDVEGEDG